MSLTIEIISKYINPTWRNLISNVRYSGSDMFDKSRAPYWIRILSILNSNPQYHPKVDKWFNGLNLVNLSKLRVVILCQDPYPQSELANGIALSSGTGNITSSLRTIESELRREYSKRSRLDYTLKRWLDEGVLMLNSAITFNYSNNGVDHKGIGWSEFIQAILYTVFSTRRVVLITFGSYARNLYMEFMRNVVDKKPISWIHVVHPSPLAQMSSNPFVGSNVFKNCNMTLIRNRLVPVRWTI